MNEVLTHKIRVIVAGSPRPMVSSEDATHARNIARGRQTDASRHSRRLMAMPVMQIRIVLMLMAHGEMGVQMRVRLAGRVAASMGMLMVFVVHMSVIVRQFLVLMPMVMALGQVQPHAERHQRRSGQERDAQRFLKQRYRDNGPDERGSREIRTCSSRSQMAQCAHEKDKADTVAHEAQRPSRSDLGKRRPRRADREAQNSICRSRRETFDHRDLHGI